MKTIDEDGNIETHEELDKIATLIGNKITEILYKGTQEEFEKRKLDLTDLPMVVTLVLAVLSGKCCGNLAKMGKERTLGPLRSFMATFMESFNEYANFPEGELKAVLTECEDMAKA